MTFAHGRNGLTTHFSERSPVIKRHITVHRVNCTCQCTYVGCQLKSKLHHSGASSVVVCVMYYVVVCVSLRFHFRKK